MDPLSGIASVLSVADIAVRSCERLRDLISDLRDAPQSVQRLRRTIQNTESVLRNVRLNVAEFNSSTLATVYHEVLPEAVERCVEEIRDDLNLLENRLAPGDLGRDIGARIRHVLSKKSIRDILGRLESQQNLLSLALQSAAQRRQIKLHGDVLDQRKEILGVHENLTTALLDTGKTNVALLEGIVNVQKDCLGKQDSLNAAVESFKSRTFGSQDETSLQLTQIQSMLSDIRLHQGRTRSQTFLQDLPRSILIPIFRTKLKHIVEECFSHNKSHFDLQVDRIHHGIDQMAQSLGHIIEDRPTVDRHSWTQSPVETVFESAQPEEEVRHSQGLDERALLSLDDFWPSTDYQGDQLDTWSRTWTYTLSIGLFCVRVSTSRIRSKDRAESTAFGHSKSAWPEKVYNLSISFQPALRMLSKGVCLTTGSRSDQRGHYFRCPEISTFAIISLDSKVFVLAAAGDAQGLKRLFAENLASPNDRDEKGLTVLHIAAFFGSLDVCEVLVHEGADPCETDMSGFDCFACMNCAIFGSIFPSFLGRAASQMITSKCAITRLFLRNGCDIQENLPITLGEHPFLRLLPSQEEHPESSEELIWQNESHHMRIWLDFLRDQNIDVDYRDHADHNDLTLLHIILLRQRRGPTSYQGSTEAIFMLCAMGANVSARIISNGAQPLHLICWTPYSSEKAFHIRAQFEILLNFGADPCARVGDGLTVTQIACSSGWAKQWFQALRKCNKLQVVMEQRKAQIAGGKNAPLDDATRTGADIADLSKRSIKGLSRRTVARGDRLDD